MDPELVSYLDRRFSIQDSDLRQGMAAQSAEIRQEIVAQGARMERGFRHIHVLLENTDTNIEKLAEGIAANYDAHQRALQSTDRKLDELELRINAPLSALVGRTESLEQRVDTLEGRCADLESR